MQNSGLPVYAPKGDRRKLDEAWLDLLHGSGIAEYIRDVPPPPPDLVRALDEFNRGAYWHCHETLEGIWLPERYPLRLFYHALIKAAVGLLHLERRNRHGALVKLGDAQDTLAPFLPEFMGIDTERLHRDIKYRWGQVQASSVEDWDAVEKLPPVQILLRDSPC